MNYIVSQNAMKVMTLAQVVSLRSLDGWRAHTIDVSEDFPTSPDSSHGEGSFLLAVPRKSNGDSIYVIGIAPNGDMHS